MKLDRREFDVVLAGLRALQEVEPSDEVWGLATDVGRFGVPSKAEISALCERLEMAQQVTPGDLPLAWSPQLVSREQKVITAHSLDGLLHRMPVFVSDGWRIVPGSIGSAVRAVKLVHKTDYEFFHWFWAVLERDGEDT